MMARIGRLFDEHGNALHCGHVDQRVRSIVDGMLASSASSHDDHIHAAYEYYGRPHFCASIGDSMGNQISIAALRREDEGLLFNKDGTVWGYHIEPDPETSEAASTWLEGNMYPKNSFHEYLGIGLHDQHVIDYEMLHCTKGTLLDLSFYQQIYSIPLKPRR
jgi:hypothetical protein